MNKRIILGIVGMIFLIGIVFAGSLVELKEKESVYIKTYRILNNGVCENIIWELRDEKGFYNISLNHCGCENVPITKKIITTEEVKHPFKNEMMIRTLTTYKITGYEDKCDNTYEPFKILYKKAQERRNKINIKTLEAYVDNKMKDKIISKDGKISDNEVIK